MEEILNDIDEACFIFLDAHGDINVQGPNPLYKEISAIKLSSLCFDHAKKLERKIGSIEIASLKLKSDLDKIEETQQEITRLTEEIEDHQDMVVSLMKSIADENTTHTKNSELDKYRSQINKNLKKLNKEKSFYEKNKICYYIININGNIRLG